MEQDPTLMCALLVGLPDVNVIGVELDVSIRVHVGTVGERPVCDGCAATARVKDRPVVELVDLPCFGRPTRLVWHKRRWCCLNDGCSTGSWTEDAPEIAAQRLVMTDRAGRWVTEQVGRRGGTVNELASELAAWHTINEAVIAYGARSASGLVRGSPHRVLTMLLLEILGKAPVITRGIVMTQREPASDSPRSAV